MRIKLPQIIQGGMGFGVSDWRLASAVSRLDQLGVVSGTALDAVVAWKLQDGDPGGHVRRAMARFPFPQVAKRVLDRYFIPDGVPADKPYKGIPMHAVAASAITSELCLVGNFVEVFLAREGHDHPVGINYLEKIQLPHLPSIYGAMLAGVSVVIMGAGIPLAVPGVLDTLARHEEATYPLSVTGLDGSIDIHNMAFDPRAFMDGKTLEPLLRPDFLPVVTTDSLAAIMLKKANGRVDGFIVEANAAGGHNAPPRGRAGLSEAGEPVYGVRDEPKLARFREFGLPFWLAGSRGSAEGLKTALAAGATGVQVGTAYGLCKESGLREDMRRDLIARVLAGDARVFTDPVASPTGFPFKVAELAGSLSEADLYDKRRRICDIGFLRQPYRRVDGRIGYRCAAEPVAAYVAKGGDLADTQGRKCLCNALAANIGCSQRLADGTLEKGLVTMGDDLPNIGQFIGPNESDFSAADVTRVILGA